MTANTTYDSLLELINDSNRKRLLKVDITHHAALGKEVRTASGSTQNASIFTAVIDDNRSEMLDGFNRNLLADPQQKRDRYMFIVGSVGTGKTIITTVMINHALTSGALIIFLDGAELIDNPIDRIRESFVDWNDRRFTGHAPFDQLKRQVEAMQTAQHLSDFLRALARQRDFPVAFVVDEAQKVYEHAQPDPTAHDGKSLQQLLEAMPQPQAILLHLFFINKDILRSTNRLALVIAGSANSRWERYLKGNERDSLFLCTPFNEECFHLQINLLPNYYESLSLLATDAERKELKTEVYNVTRGTLRHIREVGKLLYAELSCRDASLDCGIRVLLKHCQRECEAAKMVIFAILHRADHFERMLLFEFLSQDTRGPFPDLFYAIYDEGYLTLKGRHMRDVIATSLGAEVAVAEVFLSMGGSIGNLRLGQANLNTRFLDVAGHSHRTMPIPVVSFSELKPASSLEGREEDFKWHAAYTNGIFNRPRLPPNFNVTKATAFLKQRGWKAASSRPKKADVVPAIMYYMEMLSQVRKRSLDEAEIGDPDIEPRMKLKRLEQRK